MQHIIDEIEKYIIDEIEKPSAAFGGLPMCPFAAKARKEKKIGYQIGAFSTADIADGTLLMAKIAEFRNQRLHEVVMFVHPDKTAITVEQLNDIVAKLNEKIKPDMIAFSGHPMDDFSVEGVHTRKDPYPNFQVIGLDTLNEARAKIQNTSYYQHYKE